MQGHAVGGTLPNRAQASEAVSVPAVLLIVTGAIGVLMALWGLFQSATGMNRAALDAINGPNAEQIRAIAEKAQSFGGVGNAIVLITSGVVIYGALKMRSLENWSLALAASIIAMVPCFGPCCCIGLPVGIWSLVVLNKPEVKGAFAGEAPPPGGAPPPGSYTPPGPTPGAP